MRKFKELSILEKIRYVAGKIILYITLPIWLLLSLVLWKENSAFILRHINMILCGVDEY